MTKYEYDNELVQLTPEESSIVHMGVAPDGLLEKINTRIKEIVNKRGKDGWEVLYPFSVPTLWFKRIAITKKKMKTG